MNNREKSPAYPRATWDDCMEFVKTVNDFNYKSVASLAVAEKLGITNLSSKAFVSRVSSAKQFGLITATSNTIQLTDTCRRIIYPTEENVNAIKITCFAMPTLYAKLIARFDGKALPDTETLGNLLAKEYEIARAVKDSAAKCFIRSAEQLDILRGGVLAYSESFEGQGIGSAKEELSSEDINYDQISTLSSFDADIESSKIANKVTRATEYFKQIIPMQSGNSAQLIIPSDADEDGLLLLKDTFDAILKRRFRIEI